MSKKECFNCHNTKEGLTIDWWDEEDREHIEFCCWGCAETLLQKELDENTADWERNKKKIFKEALTKAKNKEIFDWPFRVRTLNQKGSGRWDRITICCPQCKIMLDWDVTAYEDNRGHKCSQCRNCHKNIERGKQNDHFTWKDDNTPSYICPKNAEGSEIVCHMCDKMEVHKKGMLRSQISDLGGTITAGVVLRQNSKGHVSLCTKRHADTFEEITRQEWADILPVFRDCVKKLDKVYNPAGYRVSIPISPFGTQNPPHFYMRIVPKYKEGYGSVGIKSVLGKSFAPEVAEDAKKLFQLTDNNTIVAERSKIVAKLHIEIGNITISTKNYLPNDINTVDQETWDQIGEVCQELIQKMKSASFAGGFTIKCELKEKGTQLWRKEAEIPSNYSQTYPASEFSILLFPRFKIQKWWRQFRPQKNNQFLGTIEDERVAEKIRDPDAYYKKWNKVPRNQLENRLNKLENERYYWMGGCGILLFLLVILVIKLVKIKRNNVT